MKLTSHLDDDTFIVFWNEGGGGSVLEPSAALAGSIGRQHNVSGGR